MPFGLGRSYGVSFKYNFIWMITPNFYKNGDLRNLVEVPEFDLRGNIVSGMRGTCLNFGIEVKSIIKKHLNTVSFVEEPRQVHYAN